MNKTIFVYNKLSSKATKKNIQKVIRELKQTYKNLIYVDVLSFYSLELNNVETIIIGSGDGTINSIVNYCLENKRKSIIYGLIPLGTANDIANNLGISSINESLQVLKDNEKETKELSLIQINNRYSLYAFSVGYLSNVSLKTSIKEKKLFCKIVYLMKGIKYLFYPKSIIIVNNEIKQIKAVLVLKTKYLGGINIKETMTDYIELIYIRNIFDILKLFVLKNKSEKRIESVTIRCFQNPCCIDGEEIKCEKVVLSKTDQTIKIISKRDTN